MLNLEGHPYFEKFIDPNSGVESYILVNKPAPVTQSFYFVNQTLSKNQKYLWMYCMTPPMPYHSLAVVGMDAEKPFIRYFPHAVFDVGSPLVSDEGDSLYFSVGPTVYQIFIDGRIERVATLPADFIQGRSVEYLVTHMTMSCDKKYILLDGKCGNEWFVSLLDMETKQIEVLHNFGYCHNHGQFSPIHPDLFILDEDWWIDPVSGRKMFYNNRIWLMNTEQTKFECMHPDKWFNKDSLITHDFWSGDGKICWADHEEGAFEMDINTKKITHVWDTPICHCHCNTDRSLWCADESPYKWEQKPCKIMLLHRESGQVIDIFSEMPLPEFPRSPGHIDPHPQFTPDGQYIVSTTSVRERHIDIAITPVTPVLQERGLL